MELHPRHLFSAILLSAIFFTPICNAATSHPIPKEMIKALERDTGLNADQIRKRMSAEKYASISIIPNLRKLLGPTYGGAWLVPNSKKPVVATTDPKAKNLIMSNDAKPVVVKNSFKELNEINQQLNRTSKHSPPLPGLIHEWGVDVIHNRVYMIISANVPHGLLVARDFIRASGVDPSEVHITETTKPFPVFKTDLDMIRGGEAIENANQGLGCTSGFSISNQNGYITAGHCGSYGDSMYGPDQDYQGTVGGSNFSIYGGGDGGWVGVTSNWTPRPCVGAGSNGDCSAGTNDDIYGFTTPSIGESACSYGSVSGYDCGTVQGIDVTASLYNQPSGSYVTINHLIKTNSCSQSGDSGGPLVAGHEALGTVSGGAATSLCPGTSGPTYFYEIQQTLSDFSLNLVTTFPGSCPASTGSDGSPSVNSWSLNAAPYGASFEVDGNGVTGGLTYSGTHGTAHVAGACYNGETPVAQYLYGVCSVPPAQWTVTSEVICKGGTKN